MIIWIASYPRSGNTLTTQIIGRVFQHISYEKYNNFYRYIKPDDERGKFRHVGLQQYEGSWEDFYQKAREGEETVFIKTHDAPDDDSPCIYIVRDGLQATESYYAYHRKVMNTECTWQQLIDGSVFPYLSWGSHLDAWNPLARPRTLLLRYEDIAGPSDAFVAPLAEFIGKPVVEPWQNNFSQYREKDPGFFRSGTANQASEVPHEMQELFMLVHRDWMSRLGYVAPAGEESETGARVRLRSLLEGKDAALRTLQGRAANLREQLERAKERAAQANRRVEELSRPSWRNLWGKLG